MWRKKGKLQIGLGIGISALIASLWFLSVNREESSLPSPLRKLRPFSDLQIVIKRRSEHIDRHRTFRLPKASGEVEKQLRAELRAPKWSVERMRGISTRKIPYQVIQFEFRQGDVARRILVRPYVYQGKVITGETLVSVVDERPVNLSDYVQRMVNDARYRWLRR